MDYEDDDSYATHFQLRALIDTRFNGLEQENNFQLFSITNHVSKDMFFIQDQDVYSIKTLINPAEAIDKYAAHLLSRQEGFFDFREYGEEFQYWNKIMYFMNCMDWSELETFNFLIV